MYGTGTTVGGGAGVLAMTGLAAGSWLLVGIGMLLAGVLIVTLLRRNSKHRP